MVQWIFHLFQFKYYHIKVRHLRQTYNFFKYLSSAFWQLSAVWFFPILWAIWTHVNSSMYRYVRSLLILLFGSELINSSATAICCRIFSSSSCNLIFLNNNCDFFSVYIGYGKPSILKCCSPPFPPETLSITAPSFSNFSIYC